MVLTEAATWLLLLTRLNKQIGKTHGISIRQMINIKNSVETMKKSIELEHNTCQYAFIKVKPKNESTLVFQGVSFLLIGKHLVNKKTGLLANRVNP